MAQTITQRIQQTIETPSDALAFLETAKEVIDRQLETSESNSASNSNVENRSTWIDLFHEMDPMKIRSVVKDWVYTLEAEHTRNCPHCFPAISDILHIAEPDFQPQTALVIGDVWGTLCCRLHEVYPNTSILSVYMSTVAGEIQKLVFDILETPATTMYEPYFTDFPEDEFDLIVLEPPFGVRDTSDQTIHLFNGTKAKLASIELRVINQALSRLTENGCIAALTANGVLFNTTASYADFRKLLIDEKTIKEVIALPGGLMAGTAIPLTLTLLNRQENREVKMVDMSKWNGINRRSRISPRVERFLEDFRSTFISVNPPIKDVPLSEIAENKYQLHPEGYFSRDKLKTYHSVEPIDHVAKVFRGKNLPANKENEGSVCLVASGKSMVDQTVRYELMEETSDNSSRYGSIYLKDGDVLIFSKGVAIQVALVEDIEDRRVIPANNLLVIRPCEDKLYSSYLMAYLSSVDGKNRLDSISTGAVVRNIVTENLEKMEIPMTDLENQEILGNRYLIVQRNLEEAKKRVSALIEKRDSLFEEGGESLGIY